MILLTTTPISNMTIGELSVYIAFTIAVIKVIIELWKKLLKQFTNWHNKKNNITKKDETLESHTKQIIDMDNRHKDDYNKINEKIDTLTDTLQMFVNETKKDNQVIFRDKVHDAYKSTIQKGYILEKDSKNYRYALDRYKANGGNSYVCDEIEPRMKDFKVFLSDEDAEEYFKKR